MIDRWIIWFSTPASPSRSTMRLWLEYPRVISWRTATYICIRHYDGLFCRRFYVSISSLWHVQFIRLGAFLRPSLVSPRCVRYLYLVFGHQFFFSSLSLALTCPSMPVFLIKVAALRAYLCVASIDYVVILLHVYPFYSWIYMKF